MTYKTTKKSIKSKKRSLEKTKQNKKIGAVSQIVKNNRERHKLLILQIKGAITIDILDIKRIIRKY